MKKSLFIVILATCVSFLPAQERTAAGPPDLQMELKTLHSTIRTLKRSQAAQKKTFTILAARLDSIAGAVKATQLQASQTVDTVAHLSKAQSDHSLKLASIEETLDVRSALLIIALVALGAFSLVIFFTLRKAIVEASQIVLEQASKPSSFTVKKHEPRQASAFVVEPHQRRTPVTLPIEPELFEAVRQHADPAQVQAPELHAAIAAMIAPEVQASSEPAEPEAPGPEPLVPELPVHGHASPRSRRTRVKTSAHCQGVTKSGSQCKRMPAAGTHFCSQHAK